MTRYENNRNRSYPHGYNPHLNHGLDDYESEGNFTSSKLPHENDNGSFRKDAWEKIDNQENSGSDFSGDFSKNINQRRQRFEERGGHYGKGPRGWKRSDERILDDVNEALFRSHDVDASDIEAAVLEGVVTLKGSVKNRKEKREAEFCAEAVSGVSDVRNEIQIQR